LVAFPLFRVDLLGQDKSLLWWNGFYPIHSGSVLALIVLRHSPHCEKAGTMAQAYIEFLVPARTI